MSRAMVKEPLTVSAVCIGRDDVMASRRWHDIPTDVQQVILEEARQLRASGMNWTDIGAKLTVHKTTLRCNLEPEYRAKMKVAWASTDARKEMQGSRRSAGLVADERVPMADLAARLAEIPEDTRTPAARLMGEPMPGRSALDRRRATA